MLELVRMITTEPPAGVEEIKRFKYVVVLNVLMEYIVSRKKKCVVLVLHLPAIL